MSYSAWLTKGEAAALLGRSEKFVERLAARGEIQLGKRSVSGGRMISVYHPRELKRVLKLLNKDAAAFVVPDSAADDSPDEMPELLLVSGVSPKLPANLPALPDSPQLAAVVSFLADRLAPVPAPVATTYISIRDAAALSGLSWTVIKEAVGDGRVKAVKSRGSWRYRRADVLSL